MNIGMLWFDDDPRKTLETKIEQAVARYSAKYGRAPNACYVNPTATPANSIHEGLHIITARTVRPNYLWLGIEDSARATTEKGGSPQAS
jgi:hypothetical protein